VGHVCGAAQDFLEQEAAGAGDVIDAAVGEFAVFDQVQQVGLDLGCTEQLWASVVVACQAGNRIDIAFLGALGQATYGHGIKHALAQAPPEKQNAVAAFADLPPRQRFSSTRYRRPLSIQPQIPAVASPCRCRGELCRNPLMRQLYQQPKGFHEYRVPQRSLQRILPYRGDLVHQRLGRRAATHQIPYDVRQVSMGRKLSEALMSHRTTGL